MTVSLAPDVGPPSQGPSCERRHGSHQQVYFLDEFVLCTSTGVAVVKLQIVLLNGIITESSHQKSANFVASRSNTALICSCTLDSKLI